MEGAPGGMDSGPAGSPWKTRCSAARREEERGRSYPRGLASVDGPISGSENGYCCSKAAFSCSGSHGRLWGKRALAGLKQPQQSIRQTSTRHTGPRSPRSCFCDNQRAFGKSGLQSTTTTSSVAEKRTSKSCRSATRVFRNDSWVSGAVQATFSVKNVGALRIGDMLSVWSQQCHPPGRGNDLFQLSDTTGINVAACAAVSFDSIGIS